MKIKYIAVALLISACSSKPYEELNLPDVYQYNIERYTLDTVYQFTTVWWKDTVWKQEEKIKLDTIKPKWWRICNANGVPTHLDYTYYLKNGLKLQ